MILPGWQPPLPSADVRSKNRALAGDVRGEGSSAAIGYEVRAAQQVEADAFVAQGYNPLYALIQRR